MKTIKLRSAWWCLFDGLPSYTKLQLEYPFGFLCSFFFSDLPQWWYCNIPSVKKKKKSKWFCGPRVPPPNPTTHHSHLLNFTHISSLFWPAPSLLSFILLKHTHSPASLHSKTHHLTIIFPARSPEKYLGTPKYLHHFIWGKSSNLFLMGIMFLFEVILPKL